MSDTTEFANSVFEQPWWLDLVAPDNWGEVFVEENEEIIARLPFVKNGSSLVMPELTQTLGIWFSPRIIEKEIGNSQYTKQKEIINELIKKLPRQKNIHITLDNSNSYILPYRWLGFRYVPTFSYRIDDLTDIENVFSSYSKHAKRDLKSAQKKVHLMDNPTADLFLNLLDKTFEKQNRSTPGIREKHKNIIQTAVNRSNGKILIAVDDDGNCHAGAFLLYDEKVCYYLMSGHDYNFRSSRAQIFIVNESIKFASTVSKAFDFEGSNIEGIENFFKQFGGKLIVNYEVIKQSLFSDFMDMAKPKVKKILGYKN